MQTIEYSESEVRLAMERWRRGFEAWQRERESGGEPIKPSAKKTAPKTPATDIQLTDEETSVALQLGVPLADLRRQKMRDQIEETNGRITALEQTAQFEEETQ